MNSFEFKVKINNVKHPLLIGKRLIPIISWLIKRYNINCKDWNYKHFISKENEEYNKTNKNKQMTIKIFCNNNG